MAQCKCSEQIHKLNQQISVMRKEINNIRQRLENSTRAHRKLISSLQSELQVWRDQHQRPALPVLQPATPESSLEQGRIQTVPIGYITSCFVNKNGTPRQPGVCTTSRASLQIQSSVFNNPDHALTGLEHFSHVWLIFLFHKNGHISYKAKVKPPRLNGQKVGVYSTRSPHRPNAIGLTLAKLENITGDSLHLSGVDLIAGTPVLDIKPYIPDYDSPASHTHTHTHTRDEELEVLMDSDPEPEADPELSPGLERPAQVQTSAAAGSACSAVLVEVREFLQQGELCAESPATDQHNQPQPQPEPEPEPEPERDADTRLSFGADCYSRIADWITRPPVEQLRVRFTLTAEQQIRQFLPPHSTETGGPRFQFLKGPDEALEAIRAILSADPRSVYRRTRCRDRLFFFSLDSADITCWFGDGFVEVLQVQPVNHHHHHHM